MERQDLRLIAGGGMTVEQASFGKPYLRVVGEHTHAEASTQQVDEFLVEMQQAVTSGYRTIIRLSNELTGDPDLDKDLMVRIKMIRGTLDGYEECLKTMGTTQEEFDSLLTLEDYTS